ncbi:signal peptidase I [Lysobacter xanthus]
MNVRHWIVAAALAACVLAPLAVVAVYVANPAGARSMDPRERLLGIGVYRVPSRSMQPTLEPGSVVVARVGEAATRELRRGDLVVFAPPHHPEQVWLKRVIGLPGDEVEIRDGTLFVNGRSTPEPYVSTENATQPYSRVHPPTTVPPGRLFVLGDNRDNSEDSRFWGFADLDWVRGRVTR